MLGILKPVAPFNVAPLVNILHQETPTFRWGSSYPNPVTIAIPVVKWPTVMFNL